MESKKAKFFKKYFGMSLLTVSLSEKIIFAKHLSMMISAGMTEVDSIRLIRKQITKKGFGKILDKIISDLESGQFLSTSLKQFPRAFPKMFVSLIGIGEVSGTLTENLNYLSVQLKKTSQLKSKVRSAMIYPVVIMAATLGITGLLVFFILPKIIPVFASLNADLPTETKILIASSSFIVNHYLLLAGGIIALVIAFMLLLRITKVRYVFHLFLLKIPVVKSITMGYNMAMITRTLGVFLKSGIKIVEATLLVSESIGNDVYKKALINTAEELKRGGQLHVYFEAHPKIFPPTVARMIEVGENTGKLDENFFYLADFYENEVDDITKNLSSILEPLLLVFMGALVGFVVISIIKPIYAVTQSLTR